MCGQELNCAVMPNFGGNLQAGLDQDPKYILVTTDTDFHQPHKGCNMTRTRKCPHSQMKLESAGISQTVEHVN